MFVIELGLIEKMHFHLSQLGEIGQDSSHQFASCSCGGGCDGCNGCTGQPN